MKHIHPSSLLSRFSRFTAAGLAAVLFAANVFAAGEPSAEVQAQIAALLAEKATRTPGQQKMSSSLIQLAREQAGQDMAPGVRLARKARDGVRMDNQNRVEVDISAPVTPALQNAILQGGGEILARYPQFESIRARVSPAAVEGLAARAEVRSIEPASEPITNVGSVTSEGDAAHLAGIVRTAYGANGTGVTVGVLSDGVNSLAASKASGDLAASANFLPGQAGAGNEGTAMMEIVQDIVPNATVLFATGFSGQASMAANILALQAAGCQIIVDDVTYPSESPFQDGHASNLAGVISGAVNTVSAAGVLFFSSAANSGNLNDGTSGTWEGDWNDSGVAAAPPLTTAGNLHNFGASNFNTITGLGNSQQFGLFWTDPLGASSNDYDLFHTDSTGTVLKGFGTNTQSGTQNPFESIGGPLAVGDRVYVVKKAGAAGRYLHLHAGRCRLSIATTGNTRGHNAAGAANAFSIAAVPSNVARQPGEPTGPFPNAYTGSQLSEVFTSDGPRRYFFNAAGAALTPGNFSSTGGVVNLKPDFSAADGNVTSLPGASGFNPFFGTSSAAPHAAAIAALLLSHDPTLTAAQIRTALTSTAIDIEAGGWDAATGAGIIMAQAALASVTPQGPIAGPLGDIITGDDAPNGAGAADGTKFDLLRRGGFLAHNGGIVFPGFLEVGVGGVTDVPPGSNFYGIWKAAGASITRLIRSNEPAPETGGTPALFDILPEVPAINDDGQVTILASLKPSGVSTPPTTISNDLGLWSELGGTGFQILIRENDQIPGLAAGTLVDKFGTGCFATARTGPATGESAFVVVMKGASTDTALLRASITGPAVTAVGVVARENTAAPGAGENFGPLNGSYTDAVRMDAAGNIAFAASLKPSVKDSLWFQPVAGGPPVKIFINGEIAPGTSGGTFFGLQTPAMGSGGTIAFHGYLTPGVGDNAGNLKNSGIWRGTTGGGFTAILRRGDTNASRPGLSLPSAAAKVGNLWSGWLTNGNRGAWRGWVDLAGDGISPFPADGIGIYTDTSGTMRLLVKNTDGAPGIAGASFFGIDHPVCGGVEQVAFIGTVTGGGTTPANNKGIWRTGNYGGPLALVLRTGSTMTTSMGVLTIADVDLPGSNLDERRWEQPVMDATGRLLAYVTFTDGSTAQVLLP